MSRSAACQGEFVHELLTNVSRRPALHLPVMNVLITGGAGYIGSVTAQTVLERGHNVVVLDDLSSGHRNAVPTAAVFVEADIADKQAVVRALQENAIDAVMHFAALSLVGESMSNPIAYYRNNVGGSITLLEALGEAAVERFVLSSTAAVYGTPDTVPITEDAVLRPENVYGETKLTLERLLGWLARTSGLGYVALRYFNAAGATDLLGEDHHPETHLIPLVLQAAAGKRAEVAQFGTDYDTPDGTAVRDYVHVRDLADAHVLALESISAGRGRAYNLGNGAGYSVKQVIDTCKAVTGKRFAVRDAPRRAGDPAILVADSRKARDELGWSPRHEDLAEMIDSAWRWHSANPDGYAN